MLITHRPADREAVREKRMLILYANDSPNLEQFFDNKTHHDDHPM